MRNQVSRRTVRGGDDRVLRRYRIPLFQTVEYNGTGDGVAEWIVTSVENGVTIADPDFEKRMTITESGIVNGKIIPNTLLRELPGSGIDPDSCR
jgi:hypothetical protein